MRKVVVSLMTKSITPTDGGLEIDTKIREDKASSNVPPTPTIIHRFGFGALVSPRKMSIATRVSERKNKWTKKK